MHLDYSRRENDRFRTFSTKGSNYPYLPLAAHSTPWANSF
jgi:hypothetical protein